MPADPVFRLSRRVFFCSCGEIGEGKSHEQCGEKRRVWYDLTENESGTQWNRAMIFGIWVDRPEMVMMTAKM